MVILAGYKDRMDAHRLAADPARHLSKDDLMRLEPSDVVPGADGLAGQLRVEKAIRN